MATCADCGTPVRHGSKRCWSCHHLSLRTTASRLRAIIAEDGEVHLHQTVVGGQHYWHAVQSAKGTAAHLCGDPERCLRVPVTT